MQISQSSTIFISDILYREYLVYILYVCSVTSFSTQDLYLQHLSIMASNLCETAKNSFGKCVYSTLEYTHRLLWYMLQCGGGTQWCNCGYSIFTWQPVPRYSLFRWSHETVVCSPMLWTVPSDTGRCSWSWGAELWLLTHRGHSRYKFTTLTWKCSLNTSDCMLGVVIVSDDILYKWCFRSWLYLYLAFDHHSHCEMATLTHSFKSNPSWNFGMHLFSWLKCCIDETRHSKVIIQQYVINYLCDVAVLHYCSSQTWQQSEIPLPAGNMWQWCTCKVVALSSISSRGGLHSRLCFVASVDWPWW